MAVDMDALKAEILKQMQEEDLAMCKRALAVRYRGIEDMERKLQIAKEGASELEKLIADGKYHLVQ